MENKRMTYDEVFNVISSHAHEKLPVFADKWSRFPEGNSASEISQYLNDHAKFWKTISPETYCLMKNAAAEIILMRDRK